MRTPHAAAVRKRATSASLSADPHPGTGVKCRRCIFWFSGEDEPPLPCRLLGKPPAGSGAGGLAVGGHIPRPRSVTRRRATPTKKGEGWKDPAGGGRSGAGSVPPQRSFLSGPGAAVPSPAAQQNQQGSSEQTPGPLPLRGVWHKCAQAPRCLERVAPALGHRHPRCNPTAPGTRLHLDCC